MEKPKKNRDQTINEIRRMIPTKKNVSKNYTKVTNKTMHKLKTLKQMDRNILTNTHRSIQEYEYLLGESSNSMEKYLSKKYLLNKYRKLNIMDAGCGEAVAMDELLTKKRNHNTKVNLRERNYHNYINKIYGISKHYYKNIEKVLIKHKNKFCYLNGSVSDILKHENLNCDVIFDIWGAYAYSLEKMEILRLYYKNLAPGGEAFIFDGYQGKQPSIGKESFIKYLCKKYPKHFTDYHSPYNNVLKMKKVTNKFPCKTKFTYKYKKIAPSYSVDKFNQKKFENAGALCHHCIKLEAIV